MEDMYECGSYNGMLPSEIFVVRYLISILPCSSGYLQIIAALRSYYVFASNMKLRFKVLLLKFEIAHKTSRFLSSEMFSVLF